MQQTSIHRSSYQGPEDEQPQPTTIYHIWREEIDTEDQAQVIEDDQQPEGGINILSWERS